MGLRQKLAWFPRAVRPLLNQAGLARELLATVRAAEARFNSIQHLPRAVVRSHLQAHPLSLISRALRALLLLLLLQQLQLLLSLQRALKNQEEGARRSATAAHCCKRELRLLAPFLQPPRLSLNLKLSVCRRHLPQRRNLRALLLLLLLQPRHLSRNLLL